MMGSRRRPRFVWLRVNTFSGVAHAQPQFLFVVANFHFDALRIGVAERVPQRLLSNSVWFVAQNSVQF